MYSRVQLTINTREDAITVPRNALVDIDGRSGVFVGGQTPEKRDRRPAGRRRAGGGQSVMTAKFMPVEVGIREGELIEIAAGLDDGARVITTGASALKDGDRIVAANTGRGREGAGSWRTSRHSLRGAVDEHSAFSHRASGHDVHVVGASSC